MCESIKPYTPYKTPLHHIPVAIYTIGLCHYGHTTPYKTVEVEADSKGEAMGKGRTLLNPSTVESVVYVSTAPNPKHIEYMERLRSEEK